MKAGAKLFLLICVTFVMSLCGSLVFAGSVSQVVFFGDSLSDDGNLYALSQDIYPKSPPYFKGRFSNGETWAEYLGKEYYNRYYIDFKNYAIGGATVLVDPSNDPNLSLITLDMQIYQYLIESLLTDKRTTLYSIWIGANDYLDSQTDPDRLTTDVVNKMIAAINTLIDHGGTNFLVLNLPDLSKIPLAHAEKIEEQLHLLTMLHNEKLNAAIQQLKAAHPNITIVFIDIFSVFDDLINHPEKYNERFHLHIEDTVSACWQGGYTLRFTSAKLANEIETAYIAHHHQLSSHFNAEPMSQFILSHKALQESYRTGLLSEQGLTPCNNASSHVFWDHVHPTSTIHRVLAKIVEEQILENKLLG